MRWVASGQFVFVLACSVLVDFRVTFIDTITVQVRRASRALWTAWIRVFT